MIIINDLTFLRKLEQSDAQLFYLYKNDPEVTALLGGFHSGLSQASITKWIENQDQLDHQLIWSIVHKSNHLCIGHVGLYKIDPRIRSAEFGILIGDKILG